MAPLKRRPHDGVVLLSVAPVKRRLVLDNALPRPTGERVVDDGAFYDARGHVTMQFPLGAGEADAGEAFAAGEDDAASAIVPRVVLILSQHRELDAIYRLQFVEGEAEGHCREYIDLDQRLAAVVIGAERDTAVPRDRDGGSARYRGAGRPSPSGRRGTPGRSTRARGRRSGW